MPAAQEIFRGGYNRSHQCLYGSSGKYVTRQSAAADGAQAFGELIPLIDETGSVYRPSCSATPPMIVRGGMLTPAISW